MEKIKDIKKILEEYEKIFQGLGQITRRDPIRGDMTGELVISCNRAQLESIVLEQKENTTFLSITRRDGLSRSVEIKQQVALSIEGSLDGEIYFEQRKHGIILKLKRLYKHRNLTKLINIKISLFADTVIITFDVEKY